ncbi:MAG TPA: pitrilysin family protein [Anaeromyxobacter sp.]|nr:pitrilysin family protein [Anaeromyxobacter sp.]
MKRPILALAVAALACASSRSVPPPAAATGVAVAARPAAAPGPDRSQPPPLGPTPELVLPAQHHFVLANGLKVRLVEYRRLPIVALQLVVDAGAARDPEKLPGLASFSAAMLTEGTRTRTATQISDEAGFLGASLSAGAGFDAAFLSGSVLSRHLPRFLELFADVAEHPAFRTADFTRVQDQRRVTLIQQRDQAQTVAAKAFTLAYWGDHPYGHFAIGTEASLAATRPADLAAFHAKLWQPENAELVVVGDVSEADLHALLEKTFGPWPKGPGAAPLPPRAPAAPHRTVLVEKPEASQTVLLLGMPGVSRTSPDYVATSVAFEVLGGGTSSRLFRNLREDKGYTYGLAAGADARRLGAASVIHGSVKADVTGKSIAEILGELGRLRTEPVPVEELEDAKNALVRSLPADFSTAGSIAGRLAELVIQGLPDDYWSRYAEEVRKVGPDDVLRVAKAYVDPARATLVLVGVTSLVEPQLAGLPVGAVEIRPPPGGPGPAKAATTRATAPAPASLAPAQ